MRERLQKIISASGRMSRRAAEKAIEEGRVSVNSCPASLGDSADPELDRIELDGIPVQLQNEHVTILLYKPVGVVTTMSDEQGRKCVADLLRDIPQRLYPIGRLDMYSEGLLLLTNDGALANRLMHPSAGVTKTYELTVGGCLTDAALQRMQEPFLIQGRRTSPAQVVVIHRSETYCVLHISIHEGRNRQIREMCAQCGLRVQKLKRIREAGLELGDLKPGQWRRLTAEELSALNSD